MQRRVYVRDDYTPDHLRELSARVETAGEARRLCAIAALLDGQTRAEAACIGGMARQTLLDWVHRYNADGPNGLAAKKPPGRPAKLTSAQKREIAHMVTQGPDRAVPGIRRWRLADLTMEIRQRFNITIDEVSLSRTLKQMGFRYDGTRWRACPAPSAVHGDDACVEVSC